MHNLMGILSNKNVQTLIVYLINTILEATFLNGFISIHSAILSPGLNNHFYL